MSKKFIILLHGVGSNGADLQGLGDYWSASLPGVICMAPDAPEPCDMGRGYQWFSVSGVTEENRAARIADARASFDATLDALLQQHQYTADDQLILVGFSQGSIMSLDTLVRGERPLAGVVAFSGRLASPAPYHPAAGSQAILIHGQADQVIPWTESQQAQQTLQSLGVDVQLSLEPGVPHTITAAGVATAEAFIRERFGF